MNMPRVVARETLDHLAEDDPDAQRSRRDLQRVHLAMGTRGILLRALAGSNVRHTGTGVLRLLELGAGDGSLMLGVARQWEAQGKSLDRAQGKAQWPLVEITLLDRQRLVTPATLAAFAKVGWTATVQVVDVLDWALDALSQPEQGIFARWDAIVANLFIHHFEESQLAALLAAIEARSNCFFACEPRRARLALAGSHLIGAIGANSVTREDAVLSVHAGFRGMEISALWPGQLKQWLLKEYSAGLFSHCFIAERAIFGQTVPS